VCVCVCVCVWVCVCVSAGELRRWWGGDGVPATWGVAVASACRERPASPCASVTPTSPLSATGASSSPWLRLARNYLHFLIF